MVFSMPPRSCESSQRKLWQAAAWRMNASAASLTGVPRPCGMNFHASDHEMLHFDGQPGQIHRVDTRGERQAGRPAHPRDLRHHDLEVRVEHEVHVGAQAGRLLLRALDVALHVLERVRASARADDPRALEFQFFAARRFEQRGDKLPVGLLAEIRIDPPRLDERTLATFRHERERLHARARDQRFERRRFAGFLRLPGDREVFERDADRLAAADLEPERYGAHLTSHAQASPNVAAVSAIASTRRSRALQSACSHVRCPFASKPCSR
jgi:hypothetical protein